MLRRVAKFVGQGSSSLIYNNHLKFVQSSLYRVPVRLFSENEPPKGFEKFKRREKENKETSEEKESAKVQRIDPEENQSQKKEAEAKNKVEEKNENKQEKEEKENEKKQKEEEEHIENEEEGDKKKKAESPFSFNLFNWQDKGDGKSFDPKKPPKLQFHHILLLSLLGFVGGQAILEFYNDKNSLSYTDFIRNYLEPEKINKITIRRVSDSGISKTIAVIDIVPEGQKVLVLGNVDHFLENIERLQLEKGKSPERLVPIEFDYRGDTNKMIDRVISFFYLATTVGLLYFLTKQLKSGLGSMGKGGGGDIFNVGKSQVKVYGLENKIKTRFKDVAGLDEAKVEIMEFVEFLKKPKRFKEIGAKIPRGALLNGPPGTGKTLLAKAAAGEAGVPFLYISGSDFVEMFVGVGASRVRDLFKKAKENAPSIIFIDEIDAVGRKRESKLGGNDERDNTLNQLLVEMDGFGTDANVVVIAATNRKELLDPALTRPGRLDRSIEVTLPDIDGRKDIFMVHLKPIKLDPSKTTEEYAKRLATLTPGFSGADISNLCNEAAILAARKNRKSVSSEEFESAAERVIGGLEKKKMVSPEERRTVAFHESGHAVVSWFLEGGAPLLKLTIIPRSKGSLGFAQYLPNENSLETREELLDRICCILGGRCSEEFFFGRSTTGAYDDLKKAYDIANAMITKFGMSEKIGFIGFGDDQYYRKHSDETAREIDSEIKRIIDECTLKTRELIKKHKTEIEKLSEGLLEKETLDLNAIVGILGERPFAPKSNFKAYLENKKLDEQEKKEQSTEQNNEDDDDDGKEAQEGKAATQTA